MAEVTGRPPVLSPKAVSSVVCKYFNFKDVFEESVKTFPSFVDQNYYFQAEDLNGIHSEFMLKFNNPLCASVEVMKGLNALTNHLGGSSRKGKLTRFCPVEMAQMLCTYLLTT